MIRATAHGGSTLSPCAMDGGEGEFETTPGLGPISNRRRRFNGRLRVISARYRHKYPDNGFRATTPLLSISCSVCAEGLRSSSRGVGSAVNSRTPGANVRCRCARRPLAAHDAADPPRGRQRDEKPRRNYGEIKICLALRRNSATRPRYVSPPSSSSPLPSPR